MLRFFCIIYLLNVSLNADAPEKLKKAISKWELANSNKGYVLITKPMTGKIEFAYPIPTVFTRKFPPGSIIKPFSSFVFLSSHDRFHFSATQKYICKGKFEEPYDNYFTFEDKQKFNLIQDKVSGRYYLKCSDRRGHGEVTLLNAISHSCNAYFLHYASKDAPFFNKKMIQDWILSEGTGFDMEQASSDVRAVERDISEFGMTMSSIGESDHIRLTALKIAQIYGSIFSDGPVRIPFHKKGSQKAQYPFPYSEKIKTYIKQALVLAIKEGTLKNLKISNVNITLLAGKTGTPTRIGNKFLTHGWNVIYFQNSKESFLLVVFTERGSGRREAADLSTLVLNNL